MPFKDKAMQYYNESMGIINAGMTITNQMSGFLSEGTTLSTSINPFYYITKVLYQTIGYDKTLEGISKMLTLIVSPIELAVKTYLLTQLKMLFSCSVNPIITKDILKNGVVFGLENIDLIDMLRYSPLDKSVDNKENNGKWYYFGCENFNFTNELKSAEDFNALLWYMKNVAGKERCVWYGYKEQPNETQHRSLTGKQTKKDGILTLEYAESPMDLKDALGGDLSIQTPFNNCIHVFIGNTKPVSNNEEYEKQINRANNDIFKFDELLRECEEAKAEVEIQQNLFAQIQQENLDKTYYDNLKNTADIDIYYLDKIISSIVKGVKLSTILDNEIPTSRLEWNRETGIIYFTVETTNKKIAIDYYVTYDKTRQDIVRIKNETRDIIDSQQIPQIYRPIEDNYYYHKPLFKFNADYVFSLKFFETRTLVARLLDALCGCLSVNLNLSIPERIVKNEVKKLIHDVIEGDDVVINDCFFTFDNKTYNDMMTKAEQQRLGLYVSPEGVVGGTVDVESIMRSLNETASNATLEQIQSAIKTSLIEVSNQMSREYNDNGIDLELGQDWKENMLESLMEELAFAIVITVVSPKLYLLFAVNFAIMGKDTNFDLPTFLDSFRNMIEGLITTIRDELIKKLKDWLLEIISDIAKQAGEKIVLEQMMYYRQLLRRCVDCFRIHGSGLSDWDMADVEADIYNTENNEPLNEEC